MGIRRSEPQRALWMAFTGLIAGACVIPPALVAQDEERQPFVRATFHGDLRIRAESWSNFRFVDGPGRDDTFVLGRLLVASDVRFGDTVRAFVQAKSAVLTDRDLPGGERAIDADHLDLQNAYVDVIAPLGAEASVTARAGRQEFLFGNQRLVSPLDWVNTRRTFDGVRAIVVSDSWELHAFWARPVMVKKTEFNDSDDDTDFFGLHATRMNTAGRPNIDAYWLGLNRESASFGGTAGRERRHTFGTRVWGSVHETGWAYDVEAAVQTGTLGDGDISASMIGSRLAYTFRQVTAAPQLHVAFDYGSGDESEGGDVNTFSHLFPLGHAFLGHVDVVGRQNVKAVSGGVKVTPVAPLTLTATAHRFWLANESDALYNAGGAAIRTPSGSTSSSLGGELDLAARYSMAPWGTAVLGFGRFFAGRFIKDTGSAEDPWFWYLSWRVRT